MPPDLIKDVAFIFPLTSNFSDGDVVPIPTLPPLGWRSRLYAVAVPSILCT